MLASPLVTVTGIAILSAALGVWLSSTPAFSRKLVPFGGGVLVGVTLFWVLPELAEFLRWSPAMAWIAAGSALLFLIDRYVYPVCPACSPSHEHGHCATRLHGFATPLLIAAGLHSALDGWSLAAAGSESHFGLGFLAGIAIHKVPEGLALGVIARAALRTRPQAMLWCWAAQITTLAGGGIEGILAPFVPLHTFHALLAMAGGSFLYLGGHAIHGELRRSGARPAIVPALTGMAGSSFLRLLVK